MKFRKFTFYKQSNLMDCGPTCIRMIAKYYGKNFKNYDIIQISGYTKEGVSLLGISEAAEKIGFRSRGLQITFKQLFEDAQLPCIIHWNQDHFVVLLPTNHSINENSNIKIADPAKGIISVTKKDFLKNWICKQNSNGENVGSVLLLEPTYKFFETNDKQSTHFNWSIILKYLKPNVSQLIQVFIALIITSFFQLIFPFLTQSIVDTGINNSDINFITIILFAQLMLVFSRTIIDFIRTRILLYISTNINFSLISDFWIKITRLPISYFDTFHTGDFLQRLNNIKYIESFLTGSAINTLFLLLNFVVLNLMLLNYNMKIFLIFSFSNFLYFFWINLFLKLRRKYNFKTFELSAKENNISLQLIQGMKQLKLHNAEQIKRWEWESVQISIFKLNFSNLSLNQIQQTGAILLNEIKNVFITFYVAKMVLEGKLTLGSMLAIQYIIGQLNSPMDQFINFIQSSQDAKISLERLNEIHRFSDEEGGNLISGYDTSFVTSLKAIKLQNFSFAYPGTDNKYVLNNINLTIPIGRTTAIVGVSGSGKTTLLKLLLKFNEDYQGDILIEYENILNERIENYNLKNISHSFWRQQFGVVLQDGYIFNESIARNIALGFENPDLTKLIQVCKIANIISFIESLPNGFNTILGTNGKSLSQGQKQRIFIARSLYKDPHFIFFDEATNALDANNEKTIIENLQCHLKNNTVIVIAHRLSTVKKADNIVVIDNGIITETGTHNELILKNGTYFSLVKNQLELGN